MIKIAICDAMPVTVNTIKQMLEKHYFSEEIKVDTFSSGVLLAEQASKKKYDIVLSAIELSEKETKNGINGMVVTRKFKEAYPEVIIIFLMENLKYEKELLNYEPFRCILKPVIATDVINAVETAIRRINNWKDKYIEIKTKGITLYPNLRNIILFSSARPYIEITNIDNDNITFRGKLDDVEEKISNLTNDFLRPNKSFLLNQKYITQYTSKDVTMINNEIISITRKYKKEFLENLHFGI